MEGWRKMTLLMVLAGEGEVGLLYVEDEQHEEEEDAEDPAEAERLRKDVRRREGLNRAAMVWTREFCMMAVRGRFGSSS